jgi:hypothetical protein
MRVIMWRIREGERKKKGRNDEQTPGGGRAFVLVMLAGRVAYCTHARLGAGA